MTTTPKPLVLIILDGFGHSESHEYNAVYSAKKPVLDRLCASMPNGFALPLRSPPAAPNSTTPGVFTLNVATRDLP